MGSSTVPQTPPSPEFLAVFRAQSDRGGQMTFAKFMELALYHPEVGYYRKAQRRVGYAPGTDFFTSSTSGAIFGELVAAACANLLETADRDPNRHSFIEIGAEAGSKGILAGVAHPFLEVKTLQLGDPLLLSGKCVVFSTD